MTRGRNDHLTEAEIATLREAYRDGWLPSRAAGLICSTRNVEKYFARWHHAGVPRNISLVPPTREATFAKFWTDEKISEMERLAGEGYSAGMIARAIGATSRNAVIGKMLRLNMALRNRARGGQTYAIPKSPRPPKEPPPKPEPPPPDLALDADGQPFTMLTIPYAGCCKWPYDQPSAAGSVVLCGHPADGPTPYCAHHTSIAFQKSPQAQRAA